VIYKLIGDFLAKMWTTPSMPCGTRPHAAPAGASLHPHVCFLPVPPSSACPAMPQLL